MRDNCTVTRTISCIWKPLRFDKPIKALTQNSIVFECKLEGLFLNPTSKRSESYKQKR